AVRVEPVDGVDQADGGDLAEVLVGLAAVAEAQRDVLGDRQVRGDEVVAQGLAVAFGGVRVGELVGQRGRLGGVVGGRGAAGGGGAIGRAGGHLGRHVCSRRSTRVCRARRETGRNGKKVLLRRAPRPAVRSTAGTSHSRRAAGAGQRRRR